MQIAFLARHRGYQIGLVCLYFVTLLFFAGNFTPEWLHYSKKETKDVSTGYKVITHREASAFSSVLVGCSTEEMEGYYITHRFMNGGFSDTKDVCGTGFYVDSVAGGWVKACQAFEGAAVLALLIVCIYTIRVNFCKRELGTKRPFVEITAVGAGVLGFLGCMIFVGKVGSKVRGGQDYSFAWSLFLTIVVSILLIVNGVVIAIFNQANKYSRWKDEAQSEPNVSYSADTQDIAIHVTGAGETGVKGIGETGAKPVVEQVTIP
ncbi:uncharacterized protein LOC143288715 [Babylonia areolata]|uniref:uncharacterized protein LOC143288715 n=1 Tax=Babylonia areolata TaxID=304850 RepID=UPI003FD430ED